MSENRSLPSTPEGEDCDHDWRYDGGDYSTGINPGWVCQLCDAVNTEWAPPSYDDDVI